MQKKMHYSTSLRLSSVAMLVLTTVNAWAETVTLEEVKVVGDAPTATVNILGDGLNVSDKLITAETLKQRATTLGDALASEVGIHSNQFGGGASAPVVRGQSGNRIKILLNNSETSDMATMSPDHAVMVDPSLASQIEIVRGATTLLYSSGNVAGVINVSDERIPTKMPENGLEGNASVRYGTGNNEKLASAGATLALGKNVALRVEGLARRADDYRVPKYSTPKLADSWADSNVGTIGLSWIEGKNYLGVSYTDRQDKYGLPAHNHEYDHCWASVITPSKLIWQPYLQIYPHLMNDSDVSYDNPGLSCGLHHHGKKKNGKKAEEPHVHGNPWINLHSKRYDLRTNVQDPIKGIERIAGTLSYVDYYHDEKEGSYTSNFFKNRGVNARLEVAHKPIGKVSGVWGVQYLTEKTSARAAEFPTLTQPLLLNNDNKRLSFFALEKVKFGNFGIELSGRTEQQTADIDYDHKLLAENDFDPTQHSIKPHKERANSYALTFDWAFAPNYKLALITSHQERVPTPQELYAHGKHIATNSFEIGNKNLTKERSNNVELALGYIGDKLDYHFSLYYNDFDNYIYAKTLNVDRGPKSVRSNKDLRLNRYSQSGAKFYGAEGEVNYQFTQSFQAGLFGDYVRGKLVNLPDIIGRSNSDGEYPMIPQADRNAPRVPQARLGLRMKTDFSMKWQGDLEYIHTFAQRKLSDFEEETSGHNLLNLGVTYRSTVAKSDYELFVKVNNVFNKPVYVHSSFLSKTPQMGRNVLIGANVKF